MKCQLKDPGLKGSHAFQCYLHVHFISRYLITAHKEQLRLTTLSRKIFSWECKCHCLGARREIVWEVRGVAPLILNFGTK